MKVLSRVMEGVGFTSLLIGGAAMDNPSILVPSILAFVGIGIMVAGWGIENVWG